MSHWIIVPVVLPALVAPFIVAVARHDIVLQRVFGIACDEFGWNDVGSWNAVYELLVRGAHANVVQSEDVITELTEGCYVDVPKRLVALVGVKDLVVVETDDALLIVDRHRAQHVSDIVKALERAKREELL